MSGPCPQRDCGRSVAELILHRKVFCHFSSLIFIVISCFFFFCILYFYLLGQMWQIKYKIHIKEYNKRKTIFACPYCPQSNEKSKNPLILCGFSAFGGFVCVAIAVSKIGSFLPDSTVQPYYFIPESALPEDHRHRRGSPHSRPLWFSHHHLKVCAELPHSALRTLL